MSPQIAIFMDWGCEVTLMGVTMEINGGTSKALPPSSSVSPKTNGETNGAEPTRNPEHGSELPGLVNIHSLLWKMAIEIVDLPIKHCDFP